MNQSRAVPALRMLLAGVLFALGARPGDAQSPTDAVLGPPPAQLSDYGLFKDLPGQLPREGVMPYDLNTPLFSDYATKRRFVWIPPGTAAEYTRSGPLEFPVGTALIKTFGFLRDMRDPSAGERLIETRLYLHKPEGWVGLPYLWNEEQTDAHLAMAGALVPVTWTHTGGGQRSLRYLVPNANQCSQCHDRAGAVLPIGPRAAQLNGELEYPEGPENQLLHWTRLGLLRGTPEDLAQTSKMAVWNNPATGDLNARARAYLDANCAYCHSPGGRGFTSGLNLNYDETNPVRYGVYKTLVAAGRAGSVGRYSIEPGEPARSILLHRLGTLDPGVRMPPLARVTAHAEGVALIADWISAMEFEDETASHRERDLQRTAGRSPLGGKALADF